MARTLPGTFLGTLRRYLIGPEMLVLASTALLIELIGPTSKSDVDDIPWVVLLPLLLVLACSMARYQHLPLTRSLVVWAAGAVRRLRLKLVVSLGLDFHPERAPRLPPFIALRKAVFVMFLVAAVLLAGRGVGRDVLEATRVQGLYTVHVLAMSVTWLALLLGVVLAVPANLLAILEVVKRRFGLEGFTRLAVVAGTALVVGAFLLVLHDKAGLRGCLGVLAFACVLPSVVHPVDPPRGQWLNIAMGRGGRPRTIRLGELIGDGYRLLSLVAFSVVALLMPRADGGAFPGADAPATPFPVTDLLLSTFGWISAWLLTGGACLAVGEFNRRRRLHDPAYPRSRVLWAVPGPEATALETERASIERAGWRLVVSDDLPGPEDADLLVGVPAGLVPPNRVPLTRVPPAMFLVDQDPGGLLVEAEERDKAERATVAIERLLDATRPRMGDHGEGTFLVPHCWLVVGLTRDDERGTLERSPVLTFGQPFRIAFGTRLRRFLYEVMSRADIDVLYVEDAVTPEQVTEVLELLFERHIGRVSPSAVAEHDFVGVTGVRVVIHEVDPEGEGIEGVDTQVTRNAISRARILIIGRDRRDDDDDDGPPSDGESSDLWLEEALKGIFPRPVTHR